MAIPTKLIYKGLKANLPASREANSFYLCTNTRELYFGADLYTEPVRFYTGAKPAAPAQGVLYIEETTGAGDVWNGTEWKNVFTEIVTKTVATTIGAAASDSEVPTAKAVKDYVAGITGSELGALAHKDEVAEADLEATLASKLNGKADQSDLDATDDKVDTLISTDTGKSARTIANEELAKQLIPENANEAMDTLAEIAAWIQAHPDDASAMNAAITKLQAILAGIGGDGEKATVVTYVTDAIAALSIGDYAKAADLTALAARVTALEGDTHTHSNKDLLDTYTQTEANLADAVSKKHEHTNKTELDKFVDGDKDKLDAVCSALEVGSFPTV